MKTLLAERHYGHMARHARLRTHQPIGRMYIQALGSLALLLAGFSTASPASDTTKYLSATKTYRSAEDEVELKTLRPHILSSRAATGKPPAEPRDDHAEEDLVPEDVEPFEGRRKIGGELELTGNKRKNVTLGQQSDDDVRNSELEITGVLSYRPSERLSAFGELKLIAEQVVFANETPRISDEAVERGETWLYFKRLFDSRYSIKIGRQNFIEPRLWWWDDDLDAVRLYYARDPWRMYVGLAEELARTSTNEDFIDPEEDDVRRLIGHVNWERSENSNVDVFYLHQRDNSDSPPVDGVIETVREDESDADLDWVGVRATGDIRLSRGGILTYRADTAIVDGDETFLEFGDDNPGLSRVTSKQKHGVRGWAVDLGVIWALARPGEPTLKLNYAYGSGDKDRNDDTDRAFRQTGLQDQDDEFRDYGELLRPELSNLRITTAAIGLPVHTDTRLTLGYHHFRQVYAAPFLRDARIDADPTGESKDIGQEISLLVEFRKWENLEIDLVGATFKAGDAYGAAAGERASKIFVELTYEF